MAEEFSGALSQRVAIERWQPQRDEAGADVGEWQAEAMVWAALVPDGGGAVAGEARQSRRRWRVTLRAPVTVGLTSRLVWRGTALAVLAVESDPAQPDRLVLRCEARPA